MHYNTLHKLHHTTPHHNYNCNCTTLITLHYSYNLQLHDTTTTTTPTTTTALHQTTPHYIQQLWWGDHCNHCNHSRKHNSNHLSVHQSIRSAIPGSQQPTLPIGFLFLKLPPGDHPFVTARSHVVFSALLAAWLTLWKQIRFKTKYNLNDLCKVNLTHRTTIFSATVWGFRVSGHKLIINCPRKAAMSKNHKQNAPFGYGSNLVSPNMDEHIMTQWICNNVCVWLV